MTELYSHSKYLGFHLFVEVYESVDNEFIYEGVAQLNGTTLYDNRRMLSGASSEFDLIRQIDLGIELELSTSKDWEEN